ncbi:6-methylsalicylic acid synthase [Delitschia confertaspora ATCC 74209]|uniref:6-methylsalicylic acid synthase n=1 Tax=Delitschia confertaspora ATCC 74209 TaxID=1513339 RepID=A0A9P4JUD9_9PLEO|nr:6-methylsalicylic acid synthase [Delitschia confertaspora ATCC 74209]
MQNSQESQRASSSGSSSPSLGSQQEGLETPWTDVTTFESGNNVAVIGMACRVAGGNNSPEDLWKTILEKIDTSSEMPSKRWEPFYRRDIRNAKVLEQTTNRGYFLENLEAFDAAFFGISPKEAEQMDPQQRLSLEVAWEALENAGIPPQSLSGSDTAVFMGVNSDDYSRHLLEDLPNVEPWMGIGTAYCGVPNRISYHMNLMGPSTAVDAACASSLVAIHHGAQSILLGESKVAIAGGVQALSAPGLASVLDKAGATCKEGRCRSFDDSANGYGRGEGAAIVILKRMSDAVRDGDNILAVLRGSAVAQDGRTNGIMAPNAKAQELVARKALQVARLDPTAIEYVEAHATSTSLGDPTEVSAISAVYGKEREEPCWIGSVKPNIGHLEAGAGAAGFIKAVLAVNKGVLPPQALLSKLNTKINWKEAGVRVVQEQQDWPETENPRRAAICSYGYGGTVSHAVIEEYKPLIFPSETSDSRRLPQVLILSAPQEKRLAQQATTQSAWISVEGKHDDLAAIATTLTTRRGHHDYRAAFVVESHDDAAQALKAFTDGSATEWTSSARVLGNDTSKDVVWVFSGHGAQWNDMAKELIHNPVFYETISSIDQIVQKEMGFSAVHALETGQFESSIEVQVLTYTMQVGLNAVLRSKGMTPDAVIGHSVGEIAASVAAGCLTPEEGALIVTRRAKLYGRVAGTGAMVLVNQPYAEMAEKLADSTNLAVAIDSSPSSCVVSGTTEAVDAFHASLKSQGIKAFRVKTDIAFHHPMLETLRDDLVTALSGSIKPQPAVVPLYSTSLDDPRGATLRDVEYWTRNMIKPVRLTSAVNAAVEDGKRLFMEVSSHPILAHSVNETLMAKDIEDFAVVNTMARNKPAEKSILYSIAQLYCRGACVDWKKQMNGSWATDVPLTTWSHKDIWRQIETGPLSNVTTHDVDKHTLLGQRTAIAGEDTVLYTTRMDDQTKPFPGSHPLHGSEIVPAAALVNTFLHSTRATTLSNIVLRVPVAISQPRDIQVVVNPGQVKICSRLVQGEEDFDASWLTHTTGQWSVDSTDGPLEKFDIEAIKARIGTVLPSNHSIDYLDKVGVTAMGFPWAVTEHLGNLKEMIARVDVAPDVPADAPLPWDAYSWAPILDAATSVGSTIFMDRPALRMPAQVEKFSLFSQIPPPKVGYLYVEEASDTALAVHVSVLNEDGEMIAKFESMRFSEIEGTAGVSGSVESLVHQLAWPPASYSEEALQIDNVVLVSKDVELSQKYAQYLNGRAKYVTSLTNAVQLATESTVSILGQKGTIVVYIPGKSAGEPVSIAADSELYIQELLDIVKFVIHAGVSAKVFVLTDAVSASESPRSLSQSPLHGLSRIIASEHPDNWGALIDLETDLFPLETMKYVREADNIRIIDGIPRVARLRSLPRDRLLPPAERKGVSIRPEGTYLITGGLGALGLEVASFLVEKGARRLILVSRRGLPPRSQWATVISSSSPLASALRKIQLLESQGAVVYSLAVDISSPAGASDLAAALDQLPLPPVLGVVHGAGVLEDQLILETTADSFTRVLAPKVSGALALHALFPVGQLDFMMLFSSCGQLFGFPGQASYASGNAFLDALATHRRSQGDNSMAIQWTSWRGLGMAASTDFINAELASKGITDVTRDEAFRAWLHVSNYDMDHAVVLRALVLEADELLPSPMLADIAPRKQAPVGNASAPAANADILPTSLPERKAYLDEKIRGCVAKVLHIGSSDEVDSKAPLSDLGVDSVMTVTLRAQLQKALGVKVPPTLTWSCPTVGHLVGWFLEKIGN